MLLLDIWLVLGYDASVRTPLAVNRLNVSESIDMPSTRFEPPSVKNKAKRQEIARKLKAKENYSLGWQ